MNKNIKNPSHKARATKALNTTAKGDAFEDKVYDILNKMLANNTMPTNCQQSKIYKKKKYISNVTNSPIIFDITIETTMPDAESYSTLFIFECKDHGRRISIDKLRNLSVQLEEVGASKGFVFTTNKFQQGAYDFAKRKNIGLVNIDDQDEVNWILSRLNRSNRWSINEALRQSIEDDSNTKSYPFVGIFGNDVFTNVRDYIRTAIFDAEPEQINVQYLKEEDIQQSVSNLFTDRKKVITDQDLFFIVEKLGYLILTDELSEIGIGECNFKTKTITISPCLKETPNRYRFTLAHEIGHIVLHSKLFEDNKIESITDEIDIDIENSATEADIKRIEIQANLFASYLLLPKDLFLVKYERCHKSMIGRNFPYLYLDNQSCNIAGANNLFAEISKTFGVSKEVVKYRLLKLDLLTINQHEKSARELLGM